VCVSMCRPAVYASLPVAIAIFVKRVLYYFKRAVVS